MGHYFLDRRYETCGTVPDPLPNYKKAQSWFSKNWCSHHLRTSIQFLEITICHLSFFGGFFEKDA